MTEFRTFPCTACGAPVKSRSGATRMACEYCGSALTIPKELQRDVVPIGSKILMKEPKPSPEMEAAEFLRQAQPVARSAFNLYAIWSWVRRFLPGCLIFLSISTCLCLIGIVIIVSQAGG